MSGAAASGGGDGSRRAGGAIFITGATGFIGGEMLKRVLTREPGRKIYCLTRAEGDDQARRRGREVIWKLFQEDREATDDAKARITWMRGDLVAPELGLSKAQQDQIDAANQRQAELDAEEEARKRALVGRARGRASLLGPGGEVGVGSDSLKTTLGG